MAQSTLPATRPTTAVQTAAGAPAALPPGKADNAAHRAQVVYTDKTLQVSADNSSLNQILREIARQTGMKITGGVTDERVYGQYGPAAPGKVLASLLEGTGSNMLLRETGDDVPAELILSARGGGPTPPNPNAPGFDDDLRADDSAEPPPQPQQPAVAAPASMAPPVGAAAPAGAAPPSGSAGSPGGPPASGAGGPTDASPNGVKTPQQIYQELQQLHQQQTAQPQ